MGAEVGGRNASIHFLSGNSHVPCVRFFSLKAPRCFGRSLSLHVAVVEAVCERDQGRALQPFPEGSCLHSTPRIVKQLKRVPVGLLTAVVRVGRNG